MKIISNKALNYPIAGIVWILSFILLFYFCQHVGLNGNFWFISCVVVGAIIAFGDRKNIPMMKRRKLMLLGTETEEWLETGNYFLFWIWSTSLEETQTHERDKIIVEPFVFNDCTGKKLLGSINAIWVVGDSAQDKENFKFMDAKTMEEDLKSYLKAKFISVFSTKKYEEGIRGQEHLHFKADDLKVYGVIFKELHSLVLSGNPDQDDVNAQSNRLLEQKMALYGPNYKFSHDELKEINKEIMVQLGKAKQIITNSALLGRYDVDGH